jgi:hypothetical protein
MYLIPHIELCSISAELFFQLNLNILKARLLPMAKKRIAR